MRKRGFTLVEAIITIALVLVITVAGFEAFKYAKLFVENAKQDLAAANFARQTMERLYFDGAITTTAGDVDEPLPAGARGERTYGVTNGSCGGYSYKVIKTKVSW